MTQSDVTFTLWFSGIERIELERTEFKHPLLPEKLVSVRGKTTGAYQAQGTFQWTSAVHALCLLILKAIVPDNDMQAVKDGELAGALYGGKGSPASSLDYALSKQTKWLLDMFGIDSKGVPIVRRIINISNSQSRRESPVCASLNQKSLSISGLRVYLNGVPLKAQSALIELKAYLEGGVSTQRINESIALAVGSDITSLKARTESARVYEFPAATNSQSLLRPDSISLGRLPITRPILFGRDEELADLNKAWDDTNANLIFLIAWGGVGKTALVNNWLSTIQKLNFLGAKKVYGYSFYSQGASTGKQSSGEEFITSALKWFGDENPELGSPWEKGERLAELIAREKNLVILDGLEPLQYPPGHQMQQGQLKDRGVLALLRKLAQENPGLCIVTSRLEPVELQEFYTRGAIMKNLNNLSAEAGAKLLEHLGVNGSFEQLLEASTNFDGHSLALTLLGQYLSIAHNSDVTAYKTVRELLDEPQFGGHASRVMEAYERWFADHAELELLYILGLFDRPVQFQEIFPLLNKPVISGLTDLVSVKSKERFLVTLSNLRAVNLVSEEAELEPDTIDCHPLVREYFGRRLKEKNLLAWQEANSRLYNYFKQQAAEFPKSIEEMGPLFRAMHHATEAGRHAEALRDVYTPRIARGEEDFAGRSLCAFESVLGCLSGFFVPGRWGEIVAKDLTKEETFRIAEHASLYLTLTKGYASPEVKECYDLAFKLSSENPASPTGFAVRYGLWRYHFVRQELGKTVELADMLAKIAPSLNKPLYELATARAYASAYYFLGKFEDALMHGERGLEIYQNNPNQASCQYIFPGELVTACLSYSSLSLWHLGDTAKAKDYSTRSVALAREKFDPHSLAVALYFDCFLLQFLNDVELGLERAIELHEIATKHSMSWWKAAGLLMRGWFMSRNKSHIKAGQALIEQGLNSWRATGAKIAVPYWLFFLAVVLAEQEKFNEALEKVEEGLRSTLTSGEFWWEAELHHLKGQILLSGTDKEKHAQAKKLLVLAYVRARNLGAKAILKRIEVSLNKYKIDVDSLLEEGAID